MEKQIDDSKHKLDQLNSQLELARTELINAERNLDKQLELTRQLGNELSAEQQSLQQSISLAQNVLNDVTRISQVSSAHVEDLALSIKQEAEFSTQQAELDQRLHDVEVEVRFLTLHADMQPAALVTLEGMLENGYRLRESVSDEGLTSYFEHAQTAHQIAVRIQQPVRQGENIQTWDMLAETFNMTGEICLAELEDFELSCEAKEYGQLQRGDYRVYPKDGRGLSKNRQRSIEPITKQRQKN